MASCQKNLEFAQLQFYLIHFSAYQIFGSSVIMFDNAVSMALWAPACTQQSNVEQSYHFLQGIKISELAERFLWAEGIWTKKIKRRRMCLCNSANYSEAHCLHHLQKTIWCQQQLVWMQILFVPPPHQGAKHLEPLSRAAVIVGTIISYNWKLWYSSVRWGISAFENRQGEEIHLSLHTLLKYDSKCNVGDLT